MSDDPSPTATEPGGRRARIRASLHGWRHPAVVSAATFSVFAGFAQFSATAALPDIAAAFGQDPDTTPGASIAAQVGLSGTTLGVGLGIIRLASLATQPISQVADRHGRRRVLIAVTALGLALTGLGALSPTFWAFVALFALARPLMSTTNAVAGVIAAEETVAADRAKAMALVTVGYGVGAALPVFFRSFFGEADFRPLFALAFPLLVLLALAARRVEEPDRAARLTEGGDPRLSARLGRVPRSLVPRLATLAGLTFAIAFLSGPINTYLFVYAENVAGVPTSILSVVVVVAGAVGALGLLAGVALADRLGRRPAAGIATVGLALTGALTYSAGYWGAVVGYVGTIFMGSVYAPSISAMGSELFPTSMRATAAGWATASGTIGAVSGLLAFGALADATGSFSAAAVIVCTPVALSAMGYARLPETRGLELEESAPEVG